jgi:hypothetical protein
MNFTDFSKSAGRVLIGLGATAALFFAAGCGSSGSIPKVNRTGFSNSNLSGTYVIAFSGTDINTHASTESYFAIAGAITADGNGNLSGAVDINDADLGGTGVFTNQSISGSTYSITQDGRGKGTLKTAEGSFGIDFVLTSNSHGLITRFDGAGTGSGTIDLQGTASQSALTSLTFSLAGSDSSGNPIGTVGSFTLNSSGTITTGIQDINDNGSSSASGNLTGANLTGSLVLSSGTAGTAQLNGPLGTLTFDVWPIDSTHVKLIETDSSGIALSGDAFTQQTSVTSGQLVFTLTGVDSSLNGPVAAGGFVTADANGTLSNGTEDYNDSGTTGTVTSFGGSCNSVAPFPSGRCVLSLSGFSNGILNNFVFAAYPSSGGIQLLEIDNLGMLQGTAFAETATSFNTSAGYGLNLTGLNSSGPVDDIAQFNTTTATTNNITGVLDENDFGSLTGNEALSGTYGAATSGRGSMALNSSNGPLTLEYYVVDSSTVLVIEGDSSQVSAGMFQLQSSGSSAAAAQTHMAVAHPLTHPHGALRHK